MHKIIFTKVKKTIKKENNIGNNKIITDSLKYLFIKLNILLINQLLFAIKGATVSKIYKPKN